MSVIKNIKSLKSITTYLSILWLIIILIVFGWNYRIEYKKQVIDFPIELARLSYSKNTTLRLWFASHGGVYVPESKISPSNPYLAHIKERDVVTPTGKKLTLLNPAYAMRQFAENAKGLEAIWKITSLNLLNPNNAPDNWERNALKKFNTGAEEVVEKSKIDGKLYLRLMRPIKYEKSCDKCHSHMGYEIGDVRGGVGTYFPMEKSINGFYETLKYLVIIYFIIFLFGLSFIFFFYFKLKANVVAFEKKEKQLLENENRLKEQLRQSQKLESIGTLAGGIAHDFNNILSVIIGHSELMKDETPETSPIYDDINSVLDASSRARNLIKQILTFGRKTKIKCSQISPSPLITETVNMLRSFIPSNILLNYNNTLEKQSVAIDPSQLQQIVFNLCTNAFHSMEQGGGILNIVLKETTISNDDALGSFDQKVGSFIQLSVYDSGIGISEENKNKIFEPYYTSKGIEKGSGLGLSIIHGIVASCNGHITFESEVNKGSAFHVFFPIGTEKGQPINLMDNTPQIKKKIKILIVDDEEEILKIRKKALEKAGHIVTTTKSSLECLKIFSKNKSKFDLLITDQMMPDLSGIELAKKILKISPDLPIILSTGYSSVINESNAISYGIKKFVMKPIYNDELLTLIQSIFNKES